MIHMSDISNDERNTNSPSEINDWLNTCQKFFYS